MQTSCGTSWTWIRFTGVLVGLLFLVGTARADANSALRFDGVDDHVRLNDVSGTEIGFLKDAFSERTVSVWVIAEAADSEGTLYEEGGIAEGIAIRMTGSGTVELACRNFNHQTTVSASVAEVTAWHHVAGVFDDGLLSLYIDGTLVASEVASHAVIERHGSVTCVGATCGGNSFGEWTADDVTADFFSGTLDEIRVWSIARVGEAIAADMYQELNGSEPGLIGYWRFDEGEGQSLYDSSPGGHDRFRGATPVEADDDPAWTDSAAPLGPPGPTRTPTPVPWSAEICLDLREPGMDEPGELVVQLTTSDASDLATYSQRLSFDPDHVEYAGAFQNGLPSGFGLQPGTLLVDTSDADSGLLGLNAVGIEGYTGPQVLAEVCFSVVDEMGSSVLSVGDHPYSSAPYANSLTENLNHHHCPPLELTLPPRATLCVRLLALEGEEDLSLLVGSEEGGADFRIVAETSEAEGLATFSQRVLYDPSLIQYGGEKSMLVVNSSRMGEGIIDVSGSGIEGETGRMVLFELDFEVVQGASTGTVTLVDNPESSAPYTGGDGLVISHDYCGAAGYETLMDRDGDGIDNSIEGDLFPGPVAENRSNGFLFDSDGDGLDDGAEDANHNGGWDSESETRTRSADTDGDGWEDGVEILLLGTDALDAEDPPEELEDLDGDGLPASIDPDDGSVDTDGDRYADAYEETILGSGAASDELTRPGLGDVNRDGSSDNADSQLALNFFGKRPMPPEIPFEANHADVDRNGVIDNGDSQYILSFFGTLIPLYPAD